MVIGIITNIVLDKNRFLVFVDFSNGIQETNVFMPEVTAQDIRDWVLERQVYYDDLETKEQALKDELLNLQL